MSIAIAFLSTLGTSLTTTASLIPAAAKGDDGAGAAAGGMACFAIYMLVVAVTVIGTVAGMWKAFEKAGQPGWAAIIPFYNVYILNEISKKRADDSQWLIMYIIGAVICGPLALVAMIVLCIRTAEAFGKSSGYGLGLAFLGFIFWPMLGFGSAEYRARRKRYEEDDEDEDEDEDDRPKKKKSRRDEEDEDEDDRPKKKKPRRDDDD